MSSETVASAEGADESGARARTCALESEGTIADPNHRRPPRWIEHAIWWQVYPLGFAGAPIRPRSPEERGMTPRLGRLDHWLDHLIGLGANGLMLGPIFASRTHGYDTVDYYRIDPRLGDDATFDALMEGCRRRGIRVMLDGVFNHVSRDFPAFREAMTTGRRRDMFRTAARPDDSSGFAVFEGHEELPELNHHSAEVVRMVGDVMRYWLSRGVSAWRLDAAYAVPPQFWAQVLPRVRHEFPETWFMGEVIHGDYPDIIGRSGMDSLTQYELWKAVWSSLQAGNFYELDWCLKRHNRFMADFIPATFIGNHDVTRIASTVGSRAAALAAVIEFSLGGVPIIYYGDEFALTGIKENRIGGDDAVRPEFPDRPEELHAGDRWMLSLYRDLLGIRRRNPWMVTARTEPTKVDNRSYSYDVMGNGGERMHVDLRLDPRPVADISQGGVVLAHVEHP